MTPEEIQAEIAQWERARDDLREEAAQIQAVVPTGYYQHNPKGAREFRTENQKRSQSIHDDFILVKQRLEKLYAAREKAAVAAKAKEPRPMSEAEAARDAASKEKRAEDKETQTPEKKLAESQLEQMKAADARSAAGLGANLPGKDGTVRPQNIRQLLNEMTMRRDPETGEYIFSRENTEGVLNPEQKRKAKELENAFKTSTYTPEEIFGEGVPEPSWNKTGDAVVAPGAVGNPFIGNKAKFESLRRLYQGAQPRPTQDIRVPGTAVDRVYQENVDSYGGALPGNPLAVDAALPEAKEFVRRQQSPEMEVPLAQQRGRMDIQANEMGAPVRFGLGTAPARTPAPGPLGGPAPLLEGSTPIRLGTGGAEGIPTIEDSPAGLGVPVPAGIRPSGEAAPPDLNQISQIEAEPPMTKAQIGARKVATMKQSSPNAAAIIAAAERSGIPRTDPAVVKALADDSFDADKAKTPSQLAAVGETLGNIWSATGGQGQYLGERFAKELIDSPSTVMNAWRTYQQQQAREEAEQKRADEARRAAGLEVFEAPPTV